jgi:hypothetical protein
MLDCGRGGYRACMYGRQPVLPSSCVDCFGSACTVGHGLAGAHSTSGLVGSLRGLDLFIISVCVSVAAAEPDAPVSVAMGEPCKCWQRDWATRWHARMHAQSLSSAQAPRAALVFLLRKKERFCTALSASAMGPRAVFLLRLLVNTAVMHCGALHLRHHECIITRQRTCRAPENKLAELLC